jgi:phenylalanyl-tRNA synthetase beta chain
VLGVAREVSALTGVAAEPADHRPGRRDHRTKSAGQNFRARPVRPLHGPRDPRPERAAATPDWMKQRLERSGQRSVSALVDISNYVMLEVGRPSHVFDLDKIHGGLDVRWGSKGESLKLLNGNTVDVDEWVGVIADDKEIESLAGIMGGDSTAVTPGHDRHLPGSRVLVAERDPGPRPQATISRPTRRTASSAASTTPPRSSTSSASRADRRDLRHAGTQVGPVDDQVVNLPQRAAGHGAAYARARKRSSACRSPTRMVADIFTRLHLPFTQSRAVHRDARRPTVSTSRSRKT